MTIDEHINKCLMECGHCCMCTILDGTDDSGNAIKRYFCWVQLSALKATAYPLGFIMHDGTIGPTMMKLLLSEEKNEERKRHCPYYADRCVRLANLED